MNPPPAVAVEAQISRYLDQIAAGLDGPRRRRARILDELRHDLDEAVADQTAHGLPPEQAVGAAIARFGAPDAITAAFAGEVATAYARRTLAWFIATGPLVGIWWLLLLRPDPWRAGLIAMLAAIPVIPLIAIGLATAASTLAATGRLMRWVPEASPPRALAATVAVALLAVTSDTAIIGVYVQSGIPVQPLVVIAVAASLTRIGCSLAVARHATALRHRLAHPPPGRAVR